MFLHPAGRIKSITLLCIITVVTEGPKGIKVSECELKVQGEKKRSNSWFLRGRSNDPLASETLSLRSQRSFIRTIITPVTCTGDIEDLKRSLPKSAHHLNRLNGFVFYDGFKSTTPKNHHYAKSNRFALDTFVLKMPFVCAH